MVGKSLSACTPKASRFETHGFLQVFGDEMKLELNLCMGNFMGKTCPRLLFVTLCLENLFKRTWKMNYRVGQKKHCLFMQDFTGCVIVFHKAFHDEKWQKESTQNERGKVYHHQAKLRNGDEDFTFCSITFLMDCAFQYVSNREATLTMYFTNTQLSSSSTQVQRVASGLQNKVQGVQSSDKKIKQGIKSTRSCNKLLHASNLLKSCMKNEKL